ncbi:myomegalin-like isoform X3 [Serinus canaria]|uniref:myomegalin-like isoform X3 n=1 Tax=Serinus canaria TaxID=9135 RepID=UPI0021CD152A|nr:myomegalin-like isoform X3 [Serinus canaria]
MLFDEFRRRKREKTNKFLESKMDENMQDLNKKVKALHKDFKKLEESTKNEVETMRAHLEKQGCKEMNVVLLLLSVLDKNLQEFSQKIETMEEDVQKWPETTKRDLQLQRHELESQGCKENEIARELKSVLDKNLQQLSQKIETLKKNAQELSKTTKCNLQLLRGFLESQEREEQSSRAQQCRMETLLEQLCQRFQSLEQAIEMRQEVPYHDLLLSRRYLENNQGIAMLREEMIHLRVLELARGERINNIWTDSRSAFEIGPAQGAVQNRRLCEGQGQCLEEKWNGSHQVLLTTFMPIKMKEQPAWIHYSGGIQRSMDLRASRTNDLQVLMLTLGVLISIIILALIFTLPWP